MLKKVPWIAQCFWSLHLIQKCLAHSVRMLLHSLLKAKTISRRSPCGLRCRLKPSMLFCYVFALRFCYVNPVASHVCDVNPGVVLDSVQSQWESNILKSWKPDHTQEKHEAVCWMVTGLNDGNNETKVTAKPSSSWSQMMSPMRTSTSTRDHLGRLWLSSMYIYI